MMLAKHFRASLIAACAFLSAQAHAADPEDFIFNINATNTETGEAVTGTVFMYFNPDKQVPVVDETLADGTLHRSFFLTFSTYQSPFYPSSWTLGSGGSKIDAILDPTGDASSGFNVDQYLYTDGHSRLSYNTGNIVYPARHAWQETTLAFKLDCACNDLFTSKITSDTFAKYDTISGKGFYGSYFYYDEGITDTIAEKHISFATTAVPEPGTVSLMMAGVGLIGARRWAARKA